LETDSVWPPIFLTRATTSGCSRSSRR
jgi:hypothetical protein